MFSNIFTVPAVRPAFSWSETPEYKTSAAVCLPGWIDTEKVRTRASTFWSPASCRDDRGSTEMTGRRPRSSRFFPNARWTKAGNSFVRYSCCSAEAVRGLSFATRKDDERPRSADFTIFFFPVRCDRESKGPRNSRRITLGRALVAINGQQCLAPIGTFRAQPKVLVEKDRPKQRKLAMPAHRFHFVRAVCSRAHGFVFVSGQWPGLPAAQCRAVAEVKERIKVIVRHD